MPVGDSSSAVSPVGSEDAAGDGGASVYIEYASAPLPRTIIDELTVDQCWTAVTVVQSSSVALPNCSTLKRQLREHGICSDTFQRDDAETTRPGRTPNCSAIALDSDRAPDHRQTGSPLQKITAVCERVNPIRSKGNHITVPRFAHSGDECGYIAVRNPVSGRGMEGANEGVKHTEYADTG